MRGTSMERPGSGILWVCVVLACLSGCAAPAASHSNAETQGGEEVREEAPQCRAVDATLEGERYERGGAPPSEAESSRTDSPSTPSSTAAPSPEPTREIDEPDLAALYAAQDADVETLGAALDASNCATAAQLGSEICRLAERVCSLDECDPRCEEARGRCTRALDRIHARCGSR
jgi:hypothetical protein